MQGLSFSKMDAAGYEVAMNRTSIFLHSMFLSLLCALPASALADCSRRDVENELSRWGYSYEFGRTTDDGDNLFALTKDGGRFVLKVETDGDIMFSKYFKNNLNLTNDDAASVMEGLSYLQIYIDSDGDIAMDYSIAKFGARRCNDDLNELTKLFIGLADEAESRMAELERREERDQSGRRPLSDFFNKSN